jgi:hypothetical protein
MLQPIPITGARSQSQSAAPKPRGARKNVPGLPATGSVTVLNLDRARQTIVQQSFDFIPQLACHLALSNTLLSRRNFLNMVRQSFV